MIALGCGLVGIGREWGFRGGDVPSRRDALDFLHGALAHGLRMFDTAPAYGESEERLGAFLGELDDTTRAQLTIATKCGEQFDAARGSRVDHSPSALRESVETSLRRLGRISILQIHKATRRVIEDERVLRLLDDLRSSGIAATGASVATIEDGTAALQCPLIDVIQFPYNRRFTDLAPLFPLAKAAGKRVLVNRPFAQGSLLYEDGEESARGRVTRALAFVLEQDFDGWILTGSKTIRHLAENVDVFNELRGVAAC